MDSQTIRTALGKLQVDPDAGEAWSALRNAAAATGGGSEKDELIRLLGAASAKHKQRGEWEAVAALLELEADVAAGSTREHDVLLELARVSGEELLDDEAAIAAYARILEARLDHPQASQALEETEGRRAKWQELASTYLAEAEQAPDEIYKSSMLMRSAEMELRYGVPEIDMGAITERLEQAVRLDPTNERAGRMLERVYRREERWEEVARVLERLADRSDTPTSRVAAGVRLARSYAHKLDDQERAARAYDRVLRDAPDHAESKQFLSEFYSAEKRWDELVHLYERELKVDDHGDLERLGDMLQIAMLHWKKREKPEDAEAWFERIRKLDPAHTGMLSFFREYCKALHDDARLMEILQGAQRTAKGSEKTKLAKELARLADGQENAQKAIEQYKAVLRSDPDNVEARDALKRLYKQTQGFNALVELLRQQLERTPVESYQERLEILREVATVYRQYIKSETALVSVLNQIVQLDDKLDAHDVEELRELCGLYEKLARWRDLLSNQLKLAEVTPDIEEKKNLYRAAARRWLDQFSNVQNATEAYAALFKVAPDDQEARERLDELYRKRRAWPQLYDLFASELETAEGQHRLTLMKEMAQLAAERLNRGADAVRLYKQILEADASRPEILDALEKYAERAKDWQTLAEALERRVPIAADDAARLVVLQKLGAVYADHLTDSGSAARTWRRVLELQPGHQRALRVLREAYLQGSDFDALEELYGSQNDWEGLAEVLSTAADKAKDNASKVALCYRAAGVFEDRLRQPDRAFRSYERILAVDPADARAAAALIPLYEKDEKWARLPQLYELLSENAEGVEKKLELLQKLVEVTGSRLSDRKAAVAYARRAYEIAPQSELATSMLEEAARAAVSWDQFVEALEARLSVLSSAPAAAAAPAKRGKKKKKAQDSEPSSADATAGNGERRSLELKLARVYAEALGRTEDAIGHYKRLLELDPADDDAASALEAILRREDRRDDLRWLLDLRATNAPSSEAQVRLLSEWAALEEDVFEARDRAAGLLRRVLEVDPANDAALRTLPRLLLSAGDAAAAAEVMERRRDQLGGEQRAECEAELAELYLDRLARPEDALRSAVQALESPAQAGRARLVLEQLMARDAVRARAAEVLAEQYAQTGDARQETQALEVLLEKSGDAGERLVLYERLASVHESKLGAFGSALDVMLRAVREFPREIKLWDRADSLATAAARPTDLAEAFREVLRNELPREVEAELCERAARLHEDRLGDPIGATPYLERVLVLDPGNERAFVRLKDIFTAAERWGELEALYDRASRATDDKLRQTEMLIEVALICEEITEDAEKATRYYERILEIDPDHDAAIRALDRLYGRSERHKDLAALLEKRVTTAGGDELLELKLRLAKIQLEKLHQPDKAMTHVEDVLRERPNDYPARELAEKLLEIGSMRARSARTLEVVYEARDEIRDLVRVLAIRLEALDGEAGSDPALDEERRELLRRISLLRDERLHDDQGALDALSRLVPADPLNIEARDRLQTIGRRIAAHDRVAEVLSRAAMRAEAPTAKGEILMQVAAIYEDLLADVERAEDTYQRVLELDPNDAELVLPAARALERIHVGSGASTKLREVLRIQVKLEQSSETRRELLGRLGELCETVLNDTEGAIDAWRARSEENPEDERALAALDRLYEATRHFRDLVTVIERRRDLSKEPALRRNLMTRSARILSAELKSVPEAIDGWQAVVQEFGPDAEALEALEELYKTAERWDELAQAYEQHLEIASSDAKRLELLGLLGDLRRDHLNDLPAALEAYRRALSIDAAHGASRDALERMLDSDDPTARREAAEVLHPIYETEGSWERLLRVLEIEIKTAEDPLTKLDYLEKSLKVADGSLGDPGRAFGYAERGVRQSVGHGDITPWLEHLERLAAATDRQKDFVTLLSQIAPDIFDGEVQLAVTLKIGSLARHQLADRELAREYYKKALELRSDDRDALSALESLYEEAGDAQNLLDVLERRAEVAENDGEKKQLLFRRARLLADVVGDRPRAIQVYEAILELELDRAALEALEKLYASEQRWTELMELYQRELDAKIGDAPELHVKIAQVAAQHQNDAPRAFEELERALDLKRQHEGAIAELERLLKHGSEAEHRARAASLLEPVYLSRADFNKVMEAIRARLEFASETNERRELLRRLAKLYEEQKEDYAAALETTAQLFHDDIGDETTQHELERLAKVAGAEKRLAEIYAAELSQVDGDDPTTAKLARRTGEIFARLKDNQQALKFYKRALSFEPDSLTLFTAIDEILEQTAQHEERVELYRSALDHRFEPAERLKTLHVVAELLRVNVGRVDEAIETYRSALDVDENDARSLDALTELYRERSRWDDLAELYLRRAESSPSAGAGAGFRLALARLYRNELGNTERAIDQLEEIVRAAPGHSDAIKELESLREQSEHKERVVEILRPLYEALDDWRHLIKLNEDRYTLARDAAEKVAVLRETARLWEERGRDLERARRALAIAFKLDPDEAEVRSEYERLAEATRAWDQLAETYEAALTDQPDVASRRDILAVLANVHDKHRDDPRRALDAYGRLYATDESEIEPLNKMEQLATLLSDWKTLVHVLTAKAEIVLEDEERASVWRRVGEAKRDMLEDREGAIEAYEHALDLDSQSTFTLDCLIELYEAKGDASRLVDLYQRRVELSSEDDEELKYNLLVLAAKVYEEKLEDQSRAIEMLGQALLVRPGDRAVLTVLNRLYRSEEMWPELLDNLKLEASTATDATERATLRKQIGEILAEKLENYDEALDAYRLVLDERPDDAQAVAAVEHIAEEHEELRNVVADVLVPVLRSTSRWDDLVRVLEMRLTIETDPGDRSATLQTIAEVFDTKLGRAADAQAALLRALGERPENSELHAEIERLAGASDGWLRYADALAERAQSTFDPDLGKELWTRIGRIAEDRLKDDRRAVEAYSKAVDLAGDQPELLEALDRLYGRLGDSQALGETLERRVAIEASEATQAELYYRLATLQLRDFDEPARALSSLRLALERAPDHGAAAEELEKLTEDRDLFEEAAEVLEQVYRSRQKTDKLAELYEKRVSFAESAGERVDMRRNLARVLEDDCKDPAAAQRVLEQGFADDPADPQLSSEVERLAALTGNWKGAALALREAVENKADLLPDTAVELCVRVASWYRDKVSDPAAAERALNKALEYQPDNDEVLVLVEDLQRAAGRERDLIETLRRRAKLQLDDDRREELYQKAKQLADGLNDRELGETVLRELLATDQTNLWALRELTSLREAAGDYKETFELLVRRSEARAQGDAVRDLRRQAAVIARDRLDDRPKAIELFSQIFEDEPSDKEAATALRELYAKAERWQDLAQLLERLLDFADDAANRSSLRLELAQLNVDHFDATDTAIELYRTVLSDDPGQTEAVVKLSELYESGGRDEDLAELLSSQITAAKQRGDVEAELKFEVRLGEVYDSRLGDRPRAIETYRSVLVRDSAHRGALEALARLYQAQGDHAAAAEILERLLGMTQGSQAIALSIELADEFEKLKDLDSAARALERGLEAEPGNADLRKRLRGYYEGAKAWEKLAEIVAKDADFAPNADAKVALLRQAAEIHAQKRSDPSMAADLLEKASSLKPEDRSLMLELCDAYSASGRGKAAAQVLEKIVESYGGKRVKELGEIHRRLATAYLADGETQHALEELDKAFRIEPGNVTVLKMLGEVAIRAGDAKKAQQMFRALLLQKLDDRSPITKAEVFLRLGEVHELLGEKDKAVQMVERAVQTDDKLEAAKVKLLALKKA